MQWFIGINEGCPAWKEYSDMAKVAIHTALRHTSLEPHCIYDGDENDFTAWLRRREVRIIPWRTVYYDDLKQLGERRGNPMLLSATRGVFLRTELPAIQERFGLDDRVLYTDCDVIFRREVVDDFATTPCRYFAVAVESSLDRPNEINTGVMWMNLPAMREFEGDRFQNYVREHLDVLPTIAWDQGAYRRFYRSADRVPLWDALSPELNWKPYWSDYSNAKIIHFHGPKPFQRPNIDSHFPELKHLTGGRYEEVCDLWQELLREAESA
jgi:hypothetical protein